MPPSGRRRISLFEALLGVAILSLTILLVLALWSFLHGALSFTDAFAVVGFAGVMVGVLAWASLSSRNTAGEDGKAASIQARTK